MQEQKTCRFQWKPKLLQFCDLWVDRSYSRWDMWTSEFWGESKLSQTQSTQTPKHLTPLCWNDSATVSRRPDWWSLSDSWVAESLSVWLSISEITCLFRSIALICTCEKADEDALWSILTTEALDEFVKFSGQVLNLRGNTRIPVVCMLWAWSVTLAQCQL